jgi:hypothetical protein
MVEKFYTKFFVSINTFITHTEISDMSLLRELLVEYNKYGGTILDKWTDPKGETHKIFRKGGTIQYSKDTKDGKHSNTHPGMEVTYGTDEQAARKAMADLRKSFDK